jgi:hypothetical protein
MTFTAILPDPGLSNGRLTVLYRLLHAASSMSARNARLSLSFQREDIQKPGELAEIFGQILGQQSIWLDSAGNRFLGPG